MTVSALMRDGLFWLAAIVCLVANVAIVHSNVRVGRGRGASVPGAPVRDERAAPARAPRFAMELVWTVLPMVALLGVLVATWRAMHGHPR